MNFPRGRQGLLQAHAPAATLLQVTLWPWKIVCYFGTAATTTPPAAGKDCCRLGSHLSSDRREAKWVPFCPAAGGGGGRAGEEGKLCTGKEKERINRSRQIVAHFAGLTALRTQVFCKYSWTFIIIIIASMFSVTDLFKLLPAPWGRCGEGTDFSTCVEDKEEYWRMPVPQRARNRPGGGILLIFSEFPSQEKPMHSGSCSPKEFIFSSIHSNTRILRFYYESHSLWVFAECVSLILGTLPIPSKART